MFVLFKYGIFPKKKETFVGFIIYTKPLKAAYVQWQGQKDLNPRERFWRPSYYHYIMSLIFPLLLHYNT